MPLISENKENFPILIVDRLGFIGKELAEKLSQDSTVVFVSQGEPPPSENVIYVPFKKKVPKIPDNSYSHIFVIDDEEDITFDFISSFFKKAQNDKAIFCFCTNIKNQKKVPSEILEYKRTRVVYLGDIFPATIIYPKSYVNHFLVQSKNRGRIDVPHDGMGITYPVFFDDAISGILEASFGTSMQKVYFLFPRFGVTLLTLAHMMQKSDPGIRIDFSQDDPPENIQIQSEGKYILDEKYDLESRIKNLKIQAGNFEKKFNGSHSTQRAWEKKTFNLNYKIFLFAIVFFLFLPLFSTLIFSFAAFLSLDLARSNNNNSKYFLNLSKASFNLADNFSKTLVYETGFLRIGLLDNFVGFIGKGKTQTESMSDYYNSINYFSNGKITEGVAALKNFLIFSQSEKNFKTIDSNLFNFISQTINVWPQIMAVDSKKTYLILFQNNLFPRATGGIIDSFGILSLDNGKVTDFKVYDTSDSDKNLKGHIEPPFALRRYMSSLHWYLRDSNFNPNFIETAGSSSFFVNLEEGKKVDGAIGVDLNFLQKLDPRFKLTDSSQILASNITSLFKNLKNEDVTNLLLSKDFVSLIEKKDVIFEFNDQSTENIFMANGFSSSIIDARENSPKTINDYTGIIESDLAGPVGSISRKTTKNINVSDNGEVFSSITVQYKNSGPTDYKNYLRFILPFGSLLKKIEIDNSNVDFTDAITDPAVYEAKDFNPPQKLEVESYNQDGKSFFGFFVLIPRSQTKIIKITYSIQALPSLSTLSDFSYNLQLFKQPGVEAYPLDLFMNYPANFKSSSKQDSISLEKDSNLRFNFIQK